MGEREEHNPAEPRSRSFQDVLQQHQQFISHLEALQDEVGGQLAEKEKELETERTRIEGELETLRKDLAGLQNAQLQWAMDRETLLKEREDAVARQAGLEQEWQQARSSLTDEKNRLTGLVAQLQQQLKAVQEELQPLKGARDKWQSE